MPNLSKTTTLVVLSSLLPLLPLLSLGCASRVHDFSDSSDFQEAELEGGFVHDFEGATYASEEVGTLGAEPGTLEQRGPSLSVIFVPEGTEALEVHSTPGRDSVVVGEVDRYDLDVMSTGRVHDTLGEAWVEIYVSRTVVGWIPARFTSEWVPEEEFCDAPGIAGALLIELAGSLDQEDTNRFFGAISESHGVRVRYFSNDEVHLERSATTAPMDADQPLSWGIDPVSGHPMVGTFDDIVGVELAEVLRSGRVDCNVLVTGGGADDAEIPAGQENLNFVSIHVTGADAGAGAGGESEASDWVTWTVGFAFEGGLASVVSINRYAPRSW